MGDDKFDGLTNISDAPAISLKDMLEAADKLRMGGGVGTKLGYVLCLRRKIFDQIKEYVKADPSQIAVVAPVEFFVSEFVPTRDNDGRPLVGFWLERKRIEPYINLMQIKFERIS